MKKCCGVAVLRCDREEKLVLCLVLTVKMEGTARPGKARGRSVPLRINVLFLFH
jgi:hypothetical protein